MAAAKRRGAGEGSIYQSGGRWVASVSLGHTTEGRKRRTVYGKTRKEVADKLRLLKAEIEAGAVPGNRGNVTVTKLLDEWLKLSVKPSLRPNTATTYEYLCRLHIKPHIGTIKIKDVTPHSLQTFQEQRLQDGKLSPRTVAIIRTVISLAFAQAVRWGWVSVNPVAKVPPPKKGEGRDVPVCTPQEAAAIARVLRSDRRGRPALLAIATGLRIGEVLGLRWADVDRDRAMLKVVVQMQKSTGRNPGGKWVLVPPKSKASIRQVSVPAFLMEELEIQRAEQEILGQQGEMDLVFTNRKGGPLSQETVRGQFHNLFKKAGLAHVRFHDLRHMYASLLLARGTHYRLLSEMMGHSNPSITLNIYSHSLPGAATDAARVIDGILDPPKGPEA